jgi:subtilisin family serine protease
LFSVVLTALAILASGLAPSSAEVPSSTRVATDAPVADEVLAQLAESGETTFWVRFEAQAQLTAAAANPSWEERGQAVMSALQDNATESQAAVRELLTKRGVDFKPFWVVNAIRVKAGADVLDELTRAPGVSEIIADGAYELPEPIKGTEQAKINALEWNISRVRAPEVWSGFGTRGEGVVVGSIDTGAQFDHPAIVSSYRGNQGDGSFDHNYNWFDPSFVCGSPSTIPCDNHGHGTHTMGTMVGDDGGENQIGVAPGAQWMTAKGCESGGCSFEALIGSAQWLLAPTDLSGTNPRPDLRPNVVNNSWGGGPGDPWYQESVRAWVAAGIFPVFSNGNWGPSCSSAGSPGDYPESYSVGAFDSNDFIADFSSRGPSLLDGGIKPDIAAPGVNVRSSVPWGYEYFSGTSMAAPHVVGTVALMYSAAPTLVGDMAETRALLDQSAIDKSDLSCGGEPENNNVWGEGTLDAFQAVDFSPRGPTGTLAGVVTDAATGAPIAGALVDVIGPSDRRAVTDDDGSYGMRLPIGDYDVTVSAFGHDTVTAEATLTEDATTTLDVALEPVPSHTVSGTVVDDDGSPVSGATVSVLGTPLAPVVTGLEGTFAIADVPEGEYDIEADAGGCLTSQVQTVVVDDDETVEFSLERRTDNIGYTCETIPANYIEADTVLDLTGDDYAVPVDLPFNMWFYGRSVRTAWVSPNGNLNFQYPGYSCCNTVIPEPNHPNAAIYPFWDDLYIDEAASVLTRTVGSGGSAKFVIEWRNVAFTADPDQRVSFEVILDRRGNIDFHYRGIEGGLDQGSDATVGIENGDATDALQHSYARPVLRNEVGVHFDPPDAAFVSGTVRDSADGSRLTGATVRALTGDGTQVGIFTTREDGNYIFRLPLGTYTLEASFRGEGTETATVVLDDDYEWRVSSFSLELAKGDVSPDALDLVVPEGETRTREFTVDSTGGAPLEFEIFERSVADPGAGGEQVPPTASSREAPPGYQAVAVTPSVAGGPVLVVMDYLPFGNNALTEVLDANGIEYDTVGSSELATIDLSAYQAVVIANDQPQSFYDAYRAAIARLTAYVEGGGFLWMGAAAWGYNGGDLGGMVMPGGATIQPSFQYENDVVDPNHPTMQGVPDPFTSNYYANYSAFENLPEGTNVIATGVYDPRATLVEYDLGAGRVLATGQPLDYGYQYDQITGRILENTVPYVNSFDSDEDVPWLAVSPTSGTIAPGDSATVEVTIDTTGLEPGLHRARALVVTNDPRTPSVQFPVTVLVPAYQVAVDSGGTGSYTDAEGDTWVADQRHTAGGWGYTNANSSRLTTARAIGGTTEDSLFQTARRNPSRYNFDNVPNGVYEIEFQFAEINGLAPDRRLADVIAEQTLLLPAHDISGEVGTYNADEHTFSIEVTDGQLNVRLVARAGTAVPILNGLRVTHRLDR